MTTSKPIDKMGMGPTREIEMGLLPDSNYIITVTAPAFMGTKPQKVVLTDDQFRRYKTWANGSAMIQDALPDLTPNEREILMTGLNDEDFHEATKPIDDENPTNQQ